MHPRNKHQGNYDFSKLIQACPDLAQFVAPTKYGQLSIPFANPKAVMLLNRALLIHYYGLQKWEIPTGYLCPPIPGRADYVHAIADLLSEGNLGKIPRGASVRGLDIGTGANCIYPIIAFGEYEWGFVGVDIDSIALASAKNIIQANPMLATAVELRLQKSNTHFFQNIVQPNEHFDFTICNPPFHSSAEEAAASSNRKWKKLARNQKNNPKNALNFGGKNNELWCTGGESAFIEGMILESQAFAKNIKWFTTLVSQDIHLPALKRVIERTKAIKYREIEMNQGQKKSRLLAWTY